MNLTDEDTKLLKELCSQQDVSFTKVIKMLSVVREYEFKERRSGIYDALRAILKPGETAGGNTP